MFVEGHWVVFDADTFGHVWIFLTSFSLYSRVTESFRDAGTWASELFFNQDYDEWLMNINAPLIRSQLLLFATPVSDLPLIW